MVVKVYISGMSGNKEVKKRQQRVLMILDSKCIAYEIIDITEPGKEAEKDYMQNNSTSLGATVGDVKPRHPVPPQLFNDTEYCGDYDKFDLANECDILEQFLKVEVPSQLEAAEKTPEKETGVTNATADAVDAIVDQIERNGFTNSREASVEAEIKTNGEAQPEEVNEDIKEEEVLLDAASIKKDLTPSEDLIANEQMASE